MHRKNSIWIGTSGWSYKHWKGTFYPKGTKAKDEFAYYLNQFNSVEINNTFYRLPKDDTFLKWKAQVPDDFLYVVKASRFITHMKKLRDPAESLKRFMDSVRLLGKKLGVILFQLPPFMKANVPLLEEFLAQLPDGHRYVFEFRNEDWYRPEVYDTLRRHNCGFCIYELAGHHSPVEITADFVYIRLHGPGNKYQGSYSDRELADWARQVLDWSAAVDVFVYFDNDEAGYAAYNAMKLRELTDRR